MAFNSGGRIPSGSGTLTVPTLTNGNGCFTVTQEFSTPPTSIGLTINGVSLGAPTASAPNGTEGSWTFWCNQATITSIGTGTQTATASLSGGTGTQGEQIVWSFYSGRAQTAPTGTDILTATGSSATPAQAYNPGTAGADVYVGYGSNSFSTCTVGAPFTLISAGNDGGGDAGAAGAYLANASTGSATCTFTSSNTSPWGTTGLILEAVASGTAYTLTAVQGSYSVVGSIAYIDNAIGLNQGSYTITGNNATLTYAAVSFQQNPTGLAYQSVAGVPPYGQKSGMLITGRINRYDPAFQLARAAGCEVLAYFDLMERPDAGHTLGGIDDQFYYGNPANVPLWPYLAHGTIIPGQAAGAQRINLNTLHMTDMTVGSAWVTYAVNYIADVMASGLFDGVFLDVVGARLFSTGATGANWGLIGSGGDWTEAEMQAWTAGCIAAVDLLDTFRRQINPQLIMINNNLWDSQDLSNNGFLGEQYVDGVCMENPTTSAYHMNYAGKLTFSNLGHRRFMVISTPTNLATWQGTFGVTNISTQSSYNNPNTPPIPFAPPNNRNFVRSMMNITGATNKVLPFTII